MKNQYRQTIDAIRWDGKRYHSLDCELKSQFHEKVYRIPLNGGMSCPNRDGTIGSGGCIFCSAKGSGDFAGSALSTITEQLQMGKESLRTKRNVHSYIAYFQAFTNTYAPVDVLESIFTEAISDPEVKVLSIATRPDCLDPEVVCLLQRLNEQKPVWVELGLQTIHEATARYIRRGYPLSVFYDAIDRLEAAGIPVIVHVILYLPGETEQDMLETIHALNRTSIQGIKLQLLHVLEGTDLASDYRAFCSGNPRDGVPAFHIPTLSEYVALVCRCISHLRPEVTIHRLTGDGPKELLIEPLWSSAKRTVLNQINQYLKEHDLWQGKEYYG